MANKIEIIGLGAGDIEQLPLGVYRKLQNEKRLVFVRTIDHPVVQTLHEEGIEFHGFDSYYETYDHFEEVYEKIAETLVEEAAKETIIYAVPGHPMLAEKTVELLRKQTTVEVEIIGGHSFLDDLFTTLNIDPIDGFQLVDATFFRREELNYANHLVFCQVYDAFIASEVKLTLLEDLPPDHKVAVVEAVGTQGEKVRTVCLEDLDRVMKMSNLTTVYVSPTLKESLTHQFATLRSVMKELRGPNGCPWDQKQTHESLRQYAVEEVYELIDAINQENDEGIVEELGDVLLQVMLHSQIGEDNGYFTVDDVIRGITNKMIHRHPHVFSDEETNKSWEELKAEEKNGPQDEFILDSVIKHAPALQVAYKLQQKVGRVGFDWEKVDDMWDKFKEESAEFHEAVEQKDLDEMENELGDMLFVLANIAKFHKINPELALKRTNEKFISRFNEVERQVRHANKQFKDMTLPELDLFWDEAKRKE